jgi:hypothetical protein
MDLFGASSTGLLASDWLPKEFVQGVEGPGSKVFPVEVEPMASAGVSYGTDRYANWNGTLDAANPWNTAGGHTYTESTVLQFDARASTAAIMTYDHRAMQVLAGKNMLATIRFSPDDPRTALCYYNTSIADPTSVQTVDINGDGALDVVVFGTTEFQLTFEVFLNLGDGRLYSPEPEPFAIGGKGMPPRLSTENRFAFGDLDGDGRPDMAVIDLKGDVRVLQNETAPSLLLDTKPFATMNIDHTDLWVVAPDNPAKHVTIITSDGSGVVMEQTKGNDDIRGSAGIDLVRYSGNRADHVITIGADGLPSRIVGPDGSDVLSSIERLVFDDGVLVFDTDAATHSLYRLYDTAFDRGNDPAGMSFFHAYLTQNAIIDVAATFIASDEFQTLYGAAISNSDFIALLYQNGLGRVADAGGLGYWVERLENGAFSRTEVLLGFSDSAEQVELTALPLKNGVLFDLSFLD